MGNSAKLPFFIASLRAFRMGLRRKVVALRQDTGGDALDRTFARERRVYKKLEVAREKVSTETYMSKTETASDLLQVCLQDLCAGCRDASRRLPKIVAEAADASLRSHLEQCVVAAQSRADRIAEIGTALNGPDNLWMGGILDDAERDTRNIERGRLLDVAIIGAVRKALAAEYVSTETASAMAEALNDDAKFRILSSHLWRLRRLDTDLRSRLRTH